MRAAPLGLVTVLVLAAPLAFAADPSPPQPAPGDSVFSEEAVTGLMFGAPDLGAELHGFVNLEYNALNLGTTTPTNTFDIHNVFLSTKAHVGSMVSLFVELEYEHGAQVKLDRAFIEVAFAEQLSIRLGRFSSALSYERIHYAAPVRLFTSRPLGIDVAFHEWVDTGLMVFGRAGPVGYNVAVVNGPRGLTEQGIPDLDVIDNNQNKTVVARLDYQPLAGLELGVAGAAGTFDAVDARWFALAELDARLRRGPLDAWLELDYRDGRDEPCSAALDATCPTAWVGETAHQVAWSVVVGYTVVEHVKAVHYLKPVARYDEFDDLTAHRVTRRATVGLNWSPLPHTVVKSEGQVIFSQQGHVDGAALLSVVADF